MEKFSSFSSRLGAKRPPPIQTVFKCRQVARPKLNPLVRSHCFGPGIDPVEESTLPQPGRLSARSVSPVSSGGTPDRKASQRAPIPAPNSQVGTAAAAVASQGQGSKDG